MSFVAWKKWLLSLPWSLRWFPLLVLFRPVIDGLYFLKDISPLLSPLYIVGVLTPAFIVISYLSSSFPRKHTSFLDVTFGLWAWLLFFNAVAVIVGLGVSIPAVEHALHLVTPALIFVYARHFMVTDRHLIGLVTTILYSLIVPSAFVLYENVVAPLSTQASRELMRFQGMWADVVSYGIFFTTGFLAAGYYFLSRRADISDRKRIQVLVAAAAVILIGLLSIHHTATWVVFTVLFALLLVHGAGKQTSVRILIVVVLAVLSFVLLKDAIYESFGTLINREISTIEREDKGFENAFHGRGSRWMSMWSYWETLPLPSKLIGVAWADPGTNMTLKGVHNDYLRVLFATGWIGLITYVVFLIGIFVRGISLPKAERFLVWGGLAVLLLYSVSTTPTLYATIQYACFSILAYAARPARVKRVVVRRSRNLSRQQIYSHSK